MNFPRKILLTDDEPHIRKFIALVLRKFGDPQILEAGDGAVAVQLYAQERPDLVLLDVNMPNMDGLQALERIRRLDPDALVVMLTSLANRQTVEECLRLGAADYLRKDTPREELTARFEEIIADCFGDAGEPETPA
ncbi:MAG: response regulator transcription factor [Verrucomicrobiota bacterium]